MYRYITPESTREAPLRMLFQPAGGDVFYKACEADSYSGLVAAVLDDPDYEEADDLQRHVSRLRMATDLVLLWKVMEEGRALEVGLHSGPGVIDVSRDEPFIRSLHRIGFLSLAD